MSYRKQVAAVQGDKKWWIRGLSQLASNNKVSVCPGERGVHT